MTPRTHFVYHVYDEFDFLLYIGCTNDPGRRWQQHRSAKRPWVPYAHYSKVCGPYIREDGFRREADAIKSERPLFNALTKHTASVQRNRQAAAELLNSRGIYRDCDTLEDWYEHLDKARSEVARHYPFVDDEVRLRRYLDMREAYDPGPNPTARQRKAGALADLRRRVA